ncbi:MAG: serine--tRNA ligase, partial [Asgard group archaeon]|nr:serine--tRNA ligase [Asgard group archaeon]
MLDIELFRSNLDQIIESEKKRFKDPINAEKVLEYDIKWREVLQKLQDLRKQRNEISAQIAELRKTAAYEETEKAIESSKNIKVQIDDLEKKKTEFFENREKYRYIVGNILHDSVPIGETEEDNEIVITV